MTPQDVALYARQQYNAVGDDFFSDAELYSHIYQAQLILALESKCIKEVYTTSTVADQQEYSKPSLAISIKRITYDGQKLMPINQREDDSLTLNNATTTATGTPQYYYEWGSTIALRPIPAAVGTLKIYTFDKPDTVSATSTLDVPDRYHSHLADYLLWKMALKDKNYDGARAFKEIWDRNVMDVKRQERVLLRGDAFSAVQDLESLPVTVIGAV